MSIPFYEEILMNSLNLLDEKQLLFNSLSKSSKSYKTSPTFITPDGKIHYYNNHLGGIIQEVYRNCDSLLYYDNFKPSQVCIEINAPVLASTKATVTRQKASY